LAHLFPLFIQRGAVRASQRASSIDCLYAKKAITYPNREYKTIDQCIINYDGHAHDLPEGLIDQSSYVSGQSTFRIHGASLQKSNDNSITIGGLDNAKIEMIERRQRRRLPWTTTGTHIVLAIRVTSLDAQVIYDQGTIGELLFGDGVTLKNVYSNCSFGKLNIVPYQGPGVVNGVAEMFYNGTVAGQNPQAVENSLTNVIRATYGWEGVAYQHIMIMLPPGTEPAFLAYTYVGNYRSVFNNDWAGYVSANVHEFGHTLGLQHSSRGGNEYMDQTGYMGYSYATIGSPSKCFNGHKNYLLGWYSDRFLPITPSVLPWTGNLVTFVDYDDALPNEPVLIQINDLYLQYNRAKSFNYQTKQNQDQVTITQAINASVISAAVGSVSMSNTTYTVFNYQGSETLLIEACSQQFVSDNGRADLYQISIYLESQISGCLSVLPDNQAPTPAPIRPTIFPVYVTAAPSRATPKPTKIVQLTTIATPKPVATVKPTAASKPNSKPPTRSPRRTPPPTPRPILSPTSFPTLLPTSPTNIFQHQSSPPTSAVATKCVDGSGTFRYRAASRNCQWLLIRPSTQSSLCVQGQAAYQLCKKTCNACS
jgi:hypothetical protein